MISTRLDFGMGNPNAAGALFAVLAIAVWLIPGRRPILYGALSALFTACLLVTASRGALIALLAGSAVAWATAGFPLFRGKRAATICALAGLGLILMFGPRLLSRLGHMTPENGSISSRTAIYSRIPAMILAAPGGWGAGEGAKAYENWFQPLDDDRHYKNLLSTHGTWMVENGWGFTMGYIALWMAALGLAFRHPVNLGVLVAWGVACAFSHVGTIWWLWLPPALALLMTWRKLPACNPKSWSQLALIVTGSTVAFAGLIAVAGLCYSPRPHMQKRDDLITSGSGHPDALFLAPSEAVLGRTFGKSLRATGVDAQVASELSQRPAVHSSRLVLSEDAPVPQFGLNDCELLWLNPPGQLSSAQKVMVKNAGRVVIVWGDLRGDASPVALRKWVESLPNTRWISLVSAGLYINDLEKALAP